MTLVDQAKKIFTKQTNYLQNSIENIFEIHDGYTNHSFLIETKDKKKWQIRIARNSKIVNRNNEFNVLKAINNKSFIYYDKKSGNAIKKWLPGINPTYKIYSSNLFLKKFARKCRKLHNTDIKNTNIINHEYGNYLLISKLEKKHFLKYKELINKYQDLPQVLSHNDLNAKNLLWYKNKVTFIDFEWARINNEYWDLANFIREVDLDFDRAKKLTKYYKKLDWEIMKDFIYICTNFAVQWTYGMQQTPKMIKYRQYCIYKMNKIYNELYSKK